MLSFKGMGSRLWRKCIWYTMSWKCATTEPTEGQLVRMCRNISWLGLFQWAYLYCCCNLLVLLESGLRLFWMIFSNLWDAHRRSINQLLARTRFWYSSAYLLWIVNLAKCQKAACLCQVRLIRRLSTWDWCRSDKADILSHPSVALRLNLWVYETTSQAAPPVILTKPLGC